MSGITTGVGLISGIDTGALIAQLLAIDSRPKVLVQQRIFDLQLAQSAYLDISSSLNALASAAAKFRTSDIFGATGASVSDEQVLGVTAGPGAPLGSYTFVVDRLVSTQQLLSKGFGNTDSSAVGASSFTFEDARGRLDRDLDLADLNAGEGVTRGGILITTASGSTTIDLSRVATVNDVLDAINSDPDLGVTASLQDGSFRLSSASGSFTVASLSTTPGVAESLGLAGSSASGVLVGDEVYALSDVTTLGQLNDGVGVFIGDDIGVGRYDFRISVGGTAVDVNIGAVWELLPDPDTGDDTLQQTSGAVTSVQGVLDRINSALSDAGFGEVTASIQQNGITLTDSMGRALAVSEKDSSTTTAADLGLTGSATGTLAGGRLLAGLNTTLLSNLNGGAGVSGSTLSITARDGTVLTVGLAGVQTAQGLLDAINSATGNSGKIVASLNDAGTGLSIEDTTGGGGNLIVGGDAAASLGIETAALGVASATVRGESAQLRYVSTSTRLEDMAGKSIGSGQLRLTDGSGRIALVDVGADTVTVYDLIQEVNAQANAAGLNLEARLNDRGDGIVFSEKGGEPAGAQAIRIEDVTGAVGAALGFAGQASGTGADNVLEASLEKTVEFDAADTLDDVVQKINNAGGPAVASIINDGTTTAPYRLSLTATASGRAGRFVVDDGGFGLALQVLEAGEDARVFYGSSDPAKGILLTSSDNTLDGVINNVSIDLKSASADPVTVTLSRDTAGIEKELNAFVSAYNAVLGRIEFQTRYDAETETRGPLLGDSTLGLMRGRLASSIIGEGINISGQFSNLIEIGFEIGEGGRLSLDTDRFREAYADDPAAVEELLAAREVASADTQDEIAPGIFVLVSSDTEFSSLGLLFIMEELANGYTSSVDGILTQRDRTITDQIEAQNQRIEAMDLALEAKRARYEAQFLAMEQALLQLQSQQQSLAQLG